ncbi:MAG: hypothetical protein IJR99_02370 [Kiritimatiellae bacterium]|nr:hypothetical protein [Kiritimatiellia bacterium]
MRKLLIVAIWAFASALYAGVPVDAQTGNRIRVCTNELTFAWDWDWEWIPSSAQTATVVARDTGGGNSVQPEHLAPHFLRDLEPLEPD